MVTFVASFIGAAAVFAGVTSAVPMDYGSMSSAAAPPAHSMASDSSKNVFASAAILQLERQLIRLWLFELIRLWFLEFIWLWLCELEQRWL